MKEKRTERSKPRLDDKILASLNGLMLKGLVDSYRYLGNSDYLELALKNAEFLEKEMIQKDYSLSRNHNKGKNNINGFLEDYASVIDAFLALYEVTFDEKWLNHSKKLLDYTKIHFLDKESGMFFFTSDKDEALIRRSIETYDKEISSSNSIMAKNLLKFHKLYTEEDYGILAKQMVKNVQENFDESAQGFSNWMHLVLYENQNFHEIAVVGENYKVIGRELSSEYLPNSILVGSKKEGGIDLLKNRYNEGETLVYVCIEGACKLPVTSIEEVLNQLKK